MNQVLSFGMVGGGSGSLIGKVHYKAASFDRKAKLVAGCFSRSFDNTLSTGKKLELDSGRLYKNFREMTEKEGAREDKIDFVIIGKDKGTFRLSYFKSFLYDASSCA